MRPGSALTAAAHMRAVRGEVAGAGAMARRRGRESSRRRQPLRSRLQVIHPFLPLAWYPRIEVTLDAHRLYWECTGDQGRSSSTVRQKYGGGQGGSQQPSFSGGNGGGNPAPPLTPAAAAQQPPQQSSASPAGVPSVPLSSPGTMPARLMSGTPTGCPLLSLAPLHMPHEQTIAFAGAEPVDAQAADLVTATAVPLPGAWTTAFLPRRPSPVSFPPVELAEGTPCGSSEVGEQGGVPYSAVFLSPGETGIPGGGGRRTATARGGGGAAAASELGGWRSPVNSPVAAAAAVAPPTALQPASAAAAYPAVLRQQHWRTPHQAAAAAASGDSLAGFELPFSLITSAPALPPMGQPPQQVAVSAPVEHLQVMTHAFGLSCSQGMDSLEHAQQQVD